MNAGDIFQQIWDYATTQWQALTFQIVITIATGVLGALFARTSKSLGGLFQKLEIDFGSVLYFTLLLVGPGAIVAGVSRSG